MRKSIFVIAAAAALSLSLTPGNAAGSKSATYVAGVGVKQGVSRSAQDINAGVGGVAISIPSGTKPLKIKADDAAGLGKILVTVCQTNGDQCGTGNSVTEWLCLTNGTLKSLSTLKPWNDTPVNVWVYAEETFGTPWSGHIACSDSLATAGTVTVTY